MPATLYGKYSKYHEENSHVLTSILNKIDNKKKKFIFGELAYQEESLYL